MAEALAFEAAKRAAKVLKLAMRDMVWEAAVGADLVAFVADALRNVENHGDREAVILPSEVDKRLAIFGLHVGGVGHCEAACGEPFSRNVMENFERIVGRSEIIL